MLATGALVASIFAVVAAPAAAQGDLPIDARTKAGAHPNRTACLGPALDSAGFSDVDMGNAHYKAVNCISYYGITAGKGDGSYGARESVTRSQMALFLSAMAARAAVDLDDAMGAGFTDLAGLDADRVNAINRLVNAGIMTGSGDGTFSPDAAVTRAEMALWLVNFLVMTTGSSSELNVKQNRDRTYTIEDTANGTVIDGSYFTDSRSTQPRHVDSAISAAFQLGLTAGYGDYTFKPAREVSRAEMATLIVQTLAHTNTRPAGLTAQRAGNNIQVSMRDAGYMPIVNEPVDVFGTAFPDEAFDEMDGSCNLRFVTRLDLGSTPCEIDAVDLVTDSDGNAEFDASVPEDADPTEVVLCGTGPNDRGIVFTPGHGLSTGPFTGVGDAPMAADDMTIWAWTGDLTDEVDDETERFEVVKVSGRETRHAPHHAEVTGGLDPDENQLEARFGQTVTYTLQLHADPAETPPGDHLPVGPDRSGNQYTLRTIRAYLEYEEVGVDTDNDSGTTGTATGLTTGQDEYVRQRKDTDDTAFGVQPGRDLNATFLVTTDILTPNSDGELIIPVNQSDPHPNGNGDDVHVTVELTPFGLDSTAADYNPARGDDGASPFDDVTGLTFSDEIIFSDDGVDPARVSITAAGNRGTSGGNYAVAPGSSRVTITVIDQYGRPVRGFNVNAISNQDGDTGGAPGGVTDADDDGTSTLAYVKYYTTRSSGSVSIGYTYRGDPGTETLYAFGAVRRTVRLAVDDNDPPDGVDEDDPGTEDGDIVRLLPERDTDPDSDPRALEHPNEGDSADVDYNIIFPGTGNTATTVAVAVNPGAPVASTGPVNFWDYLLPRARPGVDANGDLDLTVTPISGKAAKPKVTMYWADIGERVSSETAGSGNAGSAEYKLGGDRTTEGVLLVADVENKTFVVDEAGEDSPETYEWDRFDRFILGGTPVDMEVFEAVLAEANKPPNKQDPVITELTLKWRSYDYVLARDRAVWEISATCAREAP